MLRDRYPAVDLFALVPTLTLTFEPVLAQLDRLLDDDMLFQAVKRDLARRRPRRLQTGRRSTRSKSSSGRCSCGGGMAGATPQPSTSSGTA